MNILTKTTTCLLVISCLGCAVATSPKSRDKIAICHKGKTIQIDAEAVDAHLKHGDYIGYCK